MNNNEIRSTRLILKGDKELAATHAGDAKHVLAQLNNIQQTGPGGKAIQTITKQFLDGTVIKARTDVKGLNIVEITSGRFFGGKEEQKKKTKQNVNRYVAPAILCYLDTDSDYDSVPDLFVIMDKFQNFSYVYVPTKIDEVSKKISETYHQADIEHGYEISEYKFYYGSPDKNFFSKTENTERKISIRELVNCTYPSYYAYEYIYKAEHNTEEVTDPVDTDCPQVCAYTQYKDRDYSSWVSVFGKICNEKYGQYSEIKAVRFLNTNPNPPTEACPYGFSGMWYHNDKEGDFYSAISSGESISVHGCSTANPNIPEDTSEDKLFSDYSDAYFYSTKTSGWSYELTDLYTVPDSYRYLSISCDLTLFAKGKNGGEDSSCDFNILTGHVDDSYEDAININFIDSLISNYNGNPVILISYYPERKIDNSCVYGDDYFKVTYIMFYKGKIFKSNLSTEIPAEIIDAEQQNKAHELLNSKGESFTFKNKKYYSFGRMRLVEVVEETLIYT